jgi:hypothetical protein
MSRIHSQPMVACAGSQVPWAPWCKVCQLAPCCGCTPSPMCPGWLASPPPLRTSSSTTWATRLWYGPALARRVTPFGQSMACVCVCPVPHCVRVQALWLILFTIRAGKACPLPPFGVFLCVWIQAYLRDARCLRTFGGAVRDISCGIPPAGTDRRVADGAFHSARATSACDEELGGLGAGGGGVAPVRARNVVSPESLLPMCDVQCMHSCVCLFCGVTVRPGGAAPGLVRPLAAHEPVHLQGRVRHPRLHR